jgi:hypothetical protein
VGPSACLHVCPNRDPIPDRQAVLYERLVTQYPRALHCFEDTNFLENICFLLSFPYPSYLLTVKAFHSPNIIYNDRLLIGNRAMHETVIMYQKWKM